MNKWNYTNEPDFILMGLTDSKEVQLALSVLFLLIYLVTVLGNTGMILIIRLDAQLHTLMFFFLTHLSFLDLSYSTVITPKTLETLLTSNKNISFTGCLIQKYAFVLLAAAECFLLYLVIMSTRLCHVLLTGSYMLGAMDSTVNLLCMRTLHFCSSNIIPHFFCDTSAILALPCSDTYNIQFIIFIFAGFTLVVSLITISSSYVSILSTILKIKSTSGKQKPNKSYSLGKDQGASILYTIVIPMLNPLIYSLRNKEVKSAFIRVVKKREVSLVMVLSI
uniref:Olfactory receptor family 8 subfamily H member 10 n=1 Tax=Nannospalax galili TaxID=1026970 RepID=A0A8C6W397_NANGA